MNDSNINLDFCCTCLKVGTIGDKFVSLNFEPPEDISYKNKLKSCVPEMGLQNTDDCFLCKPCSAALETAYTFRCMCLRTETRLEDFKKAQFKPSPITDKNIKQELIESCVVEENSVKPRKLCMQSENFPVLQAEGFVCPGTVNKEVEEEDFSRSEENCVSKIDIVKEELENLLTESVGSAIDINIHIFNEQSQHSRKINSKVDIFNSLSPEIKEIENQLKFSGNKEENKFVTPQEEEIKTKPLSDSEIIEISCKTIPDLLNYNPENLSCQVALEKMEISELLVKIPTKITSSKSKGKAYWCTVCKKDVYRKERYHAHILKHSNVRAYRCNICKRGFFSSETLSKHKKACVDLNPDFNTIRVESKVTSIDKPPKRKYVRKPINKVQLKPKIERDDNNRVVTSIRKSTRQQTPSKKLCNLNDTIFRCKFCNYQSYWKQKYRVHLLHHTNDKQFPCLECPKRFYEKWELNRHTRTTHQPKTKPSPKRTKKQPNWEPNFLEPAVSLIVNPGTVVTPIIQSIHSLAETSNISSISYSCKICKVSFSSRGLLMSHVQTHKNKSLEPEGLDVQLELAPKILKKKKRKKFFCSVCNSEFSSRDHANIHTGAKPYICEVCNKQFAAYTTLRKHNRTHQNGGGSSKKNNKRQVSSQKKGFLCEICKKKFAKKEHVYSHNCQNASGDSVYRCQICKNAFIGRAALIEHMGIHVSQTENAAE